MEEKNKVNLKVAVIMGAATIAVAFVLYSVFMAYVNRADPATLQAEALLAEAQAKEYEGESNLVQAKANLVSAYPDTITAAGETALQFGLGLFLTLIGLGAAWLIFSIGTSFILRSSANAYRDVNAIRVLPELQLHTGSQHFALAGAPINRDVHSEDLGIASPGASSRANSKNPAGVGDTAGNGGSAGAVARYNRGAQKGK